MQRKPKVNGNQGLCTVLGKKGGALRCAVVLPLTEMAATSSGLSHAVMVRTVAPIRANFRDLLRFIVLPFELFENNVIRINQQTS